MIEFLASLQGMGANSLAALGSAETALAGVTDPINQLGGLLDKKSNELSNKLDSGFRNTAFGKSGFAKGTGLDGLFSPSDNPNISKHSAYTPVSMPNSVSNFQGVNQLTNNPSVGMLSQEQQGQDVGIPYVYSPALTDSEETGIKLKKDENKAVQDVINADPALAPVEVVQPVDYEHGSLYEKPEEVLSVSDFINAGQ